MKIFTFLSAVLVIATSFKEINNQKEIDQITKKHL